MCVFAQNLCKNDDEALCKCLNFQQKAQLCNRSENRALKVTIHVQK